MVSGVSGIVRTDSPVFVGPKTGFVTSGFRS